VAIPEIQLRNDLFRGIPGHLLLGADLSISEVEIPAGTTIFREGDPPDYCYLVASGSVHITKERPGGGEQLLGVVEAGDFFGELALYDGTPRSARAVTITGSRLGRLDQRAFEYLRRVALPQLASTLADRTIERVRRTNELVVSGRIRDFVDAAAGELPSSPAGECPRCGTVGDAPGVPCGHCGTVLKAAPVPAVVAGKFRILERVGTGGMGVVYRALDMGLRRDVAIKTLPRMSAREAYHLRSEARAMASVPHPNLALIYGVEAWRGVPMLIMEHLPGGTLGDRLGTAPLALTEALELGITLAGALERLHGAGLLHRDIKPTNIGYGPTGTPKLLDFGLALTLPGAEHSPGRAGAGAEAAEGGGGEDHDPPPGGTPLYLPPEAIGGGFPDPAWDLWALAITLYEALTGSHPLDHVPFHAAVLRLCQGAIPDVRESAPYLPEEVAAFFRAALAPDRSVRPATATAFRGAVGRLLDRARSSMPPGYP
jgi:CRP-like cAMP-binding protein